MKVRIDPRYVGVLYYQSQNVLYRARMNSELSGDAKYASMSLKQVQEFHKLLKEKRSYGEAYNIVLRVNYQKINKVIIENSSSNSRAKTKNLRNNRANEKDLINSQNRLDNYLENPCIEANDAHLSTESKMIPAPKQVENIYEAIDKFNADKEEDFDDV